MYDTDYPVFDPALFRVVDVEAADVTVTLSPEPAIGTRCELQRSDTSGPGRLVAQAAGDDRIGGFPGVCQLVLMSPGQECTLEYHRVIVQAGGRLEEDLTAGVWFIL